MRVKLLAHTSNPESVVGAATRLCRSRADADEILRGSAGELEVSLKKAIERGHFSVIEHATFTFSITGISRACSHQLVRHRMASYSQQSQRHVRLEEGSYIVPPTIAGDERARRGYRGLMDRVLKGYSELLEIGIPVEDARFVLPNATKTNLVMTMNARSLTNFFELRCCLHAQWEIRKLAYEMLRQVKKVAPLIFKNAGPPCKSRGICPEKDISCSLYRKYIDDTNNFFRNQYKHKSGS